MADPFPTFDVLPACPTDHHYYRDDLPTDVASRVHKKIIQEWKLLESHLPDSIHVRAYEDRITHLREAIGGVAGTPYHDGLFFFDVAFPVNYPHSPPKVHYRSFGLQINPHIYSFGYVCLSLLTSLLGEKEETWDPSQSTVLQVLLSIQALVFSERPLFNEPAYERMKGRKKWERIADTYNEIVFCLSCRTMLYVISKPPEGFEALVVGHFLERGRRVLLAARAYASSRARVGYYSSTEDDEDQVNVSSRGRRGARMKFRMDMVELYPNMVDSFRSHGVAVDDLLELGVKPVSKVYVVKGIKKGWSKLKHILGLGPLGLYL